MIPFYRDKKVCRWLFVRFVPSKNFIAVTDMGQKRLKRNKTKYSYPFSPHVKKGQTVGCQKHWKLVWWLLAYRNDEE
jgi:hypothetical protein